MAEKEDDPTNSLRQLPVGQMDHIRKMFNAVNDEKKKDSSSNGLSSTESSPFRQRPVTAKINIPLKAQERKNVNHRSPARPVSEFVPRQGLTVATELHKIKSDESLNSPKKLALEKPAIVKKPSFKGTDNENKVQLRKKENTDSQPRNSVVQLRAQMFESTDSSQAANKPPQANLQPRPIIKPPIKPRSRPPSGSIDVEESKPAENAYDQAWDLKKKIVIPPAPPPKKPPRTGAHDEYMKVKLLGLGANANKAPSSQGGVPIYETVADENDEESKNKAAAADDKDPTTSPVYRKITRSRPSSAEIQDSGHIKSKKPNRPPPPRPQSKCAISENTDSTGNEQQKPALPRKPVKFHLYEDVDSLKVDLDAIKHWDLPPSPLPKGTLKRSLSADSLMMDSPVYVDPAKVVNFRDDTDYDVYIDNTGYAVPYRHQRLKSTSSLDRERLESAGICRPISDVVKQLKKIKPFKPKRDPEAAKNNWKKIQLRDRKVKMKINLAFAVLRQMKPEDKTKDEEHADVNVVEAHSLVDEKEIEKRINHCGIVRQNTSKSVRKSRIQQTQIYSQLFDFCLIVGLEPKEDLIGYVPKVIYKFPAHVESNVSIPEFCFPDAEEFDVKTASPAAPSESYSFVLTSLDGERLYGYCRRLVPFTSVDGLPEVLCIVSPVDAFSMYNELLNEVETCRHKSLDLARELLTASFGRPLPDPGGMVHVRTLDENWDTGTILLSRPSDTRVDNVNREYLLSKLGVDKLIKLFSCILLERSILFCAKSLSTLSQTIHALASLLYPFRWQHTYIPVLPESMLDVCCSPTPYIIGILSSQLAYVQTLPISEIVIFDLNKKQLIKSQGDEGSLLPKDLQKALKTALNMTKVDADMRMTQNMMISESFLRMFVETVGHYGDHITVQQDGQNIFVKESFISNAQSDSIRQFLQWFTETQMFEVFVTEQIEKPKSNRKNSKTIELFNQRIMEYREEISGDVKKLKKNKGLMKLLNM